MSRRFVPITAPLIALGLGWVIVELALRLVGVAYPAWSRPTQGVREWGIPNVEGWAVGETRTWVTLNAEGLRDVDHSIAKPEGVFRILVVGDSYVAAFEVEREQAFWSVMERELSSCVALQGNRVEVIGLGKRGFGTTEELLALRRFGLAYDPDWVVLAFLSGNDFRNNSRALKESDRPYHVYEGESLVLDESYAESAEFERWAGWQGDLWYGLVRHSRLVQVLRHLRRQIKVALELAKSEREGEGVEVGLDDQIYLEPTGPDWQSAWRVTEGVIGLMRDEVERAGARFLLLTLSNAIQVNPDRALRERYAERIGAEDLFYPDRRLGRFAREAGIWSLALAPDLRDWAEENATCVHGFQEPWLCQGHWNAEGHRVAGERLADALCQELSARP